MPDDPAEDEALSVSVPGVREVQWRDCFFWGEYVCPLEHRRRVGLPPAGPDRDAGEGEGG